MQAARRLLHVLLVVLILLIGTAAATAIVSQTAWFKNRVRVYVIAQASKYLNGDIKIDRLGGNLFSGLELEGISISIEGQPVVAVKDIGLHYNLYQLITSNMTIDELRVNEPVVRVEQDGEGWTIAQLIKKQEQEANRQGPLAPIRIDDIGISNGSILVADRVGVPGVEIPKRLERIDAKLSFAYEPVHYSIAIDHVSFRASEPELALNSFSGAMAIRDDTLFLQSISIRTAETSLAVDGAVEQYLSSPVLKLTVTSDKTSVPEIARLVPAVAGIALQPAFEFRLSGPLDRLGVDMNVRSSAGQIAGTLTTDLAAPGYAASGNVSVQHLNLAPLLNDKTKASDLTAQAAVDLRSESLSSPDSLSGTIKVDANKIVAAGYAVNRLTGTATLHGRRIDVNARTAAYGATASAAGRVVVPEGTGPLTFDLRGQARHLNAAAFPSSLSLPSVKTEVNADYHVVGNADVAGGGHRAALVLDATLADSSVANAKILSGSTVQVDARQSALAYTASANVQDVDLQQLGSAFGVKALADDRYRSRIDGHVELEGRGTTIQELDARASGTIANASLVDGQITNANFDASIANNRAHLTAAGTFADLDPARVSGDGRFQGNVGGQFDLDATTEDVAGGITLDSVSGTAKLALAASTVGKIAFDHAALDADYQQRTGDIRQLEIVGADANVSAHGTLALGDTGNSNLTFHADSPRLAEIGSLFDVPVAGIGSVDGTVTGNRTELKAAGHLTGDGLTYQENGALTLTSSYTARVPDLDIKRAEIDADSRATFVEVAGQQIDELSGTASYADQRVGFDLTASQPKRSARASGALLLHPDHQEVHLERLALATGNQEWSIPQGEQATINYAHDEIAVDKVHLVSGDQEIRADGRFGQAGSALDVTLNNVELARVDELLLRPPQFTGRLNASATIEGTREHPLVNGQFQVSGGGFRQFAYDSFGGTVRYEGSGATVDAKLQQNATQWITAKGYLPAALFIAKKGDASAVPPTGHIESAEVAAGDRIDLAVDSSPLGLGILQGFTNEVTKVQGTLEAHVHVTGAADDPHPEGAVTLADGALTVASTGVAYSHIAGRVDLQPDRVHIDEITVLDNHDSALSLTGDLAVHERQVGDFRLWITADDFKVVDNKLGNLRVQSALELVGELRSPEIRGDFGVSTGRLDLDEIMAQIPSAYSTEAIGDPNRTAAQATVTQPEHRSIFDALRMKVRLTVPDDLIVNSSGIEVPGALIDLGALNVTLGGDLTATKDPAGTVRLTGSVNTVRGTYEFQGRRFDVLREGGIHFDGTEDFDPRLDLRTRRLIQGVDTHVDIRGTLKQPQVALSSIPPLEDADILALVVFNQPLNQLGAGQQMTLVERAQSLAAGALAGTLSQSIAKALNLETFRFDVASANSPALTVGQQLGPNLYVRVQQAIGETTNTNLLLEYAFTNWLRLQTNVQQGSPAETSRFVRSQGTGADLIFLFSK